MVNKIIISPSILGYEGNLDQHMGDIARIIEAGIEWIHVDLMRKPFISDRDAFSEESLVKLINEFGCAHLDFHLMVSKSDQIDPIIDIIDAKIPSERKQDTTITLHREAYRYDQDIESRFNLGKHARKEFDLSIYNSNGGELERNLAAANVITGMRVYDKLKELHGAGYRTGLALEPEISLGNISVEMLPLLNMILLMTVQSGAGNQTYIPTVTAKIEQARGLYPDLMIQVDGGINDKTIATAVSAGANNLVIGSYIAGVENLAKRIVYVQEMIRNVEG